MPNSPSIPVALCDSCSLHEINIYCEGHVTVEQMVRICGKVPEPSSYLSSRFVATNFPTNMFTDGTISRFATATAISPTDINTIDSESARSDPLDDVFGGDSDGDDSYSRQLRDDGVRQQGRNEDVSDVPRLQGIHTTNGYRDGIAASKEQYLQEGFDEGYSLGAELGAAAGRIIGVLESLMVAIRTEEEHVNAKIEVAEMLSQAESQLSAKGLYDQEYFGEDGIWKYEVSTHDESLGEENVTFRIVARGHPLIQKWSGIVDGLLERYQLTKRDP